MAKTKFYMLRMSIAQYDCMRTKAHAFGYLSLAAYLRSSGLEREHLTPERICTLYEAQVQGKTERKKTYKLNKMYQKSLDHWR